MCNKSEHRKRSGQKCREAWDDCKKARGKKGFSSRIKVKATKEERSTFGKQGKGEILLRGGGGGFAGEEGNGKGSQENDFLEGRPGKRPPRI